MHTITFDPRVPCQIILVGVGGTGSLILTHLVRLDQAVRALGGAGLWVRAFDPDRVSVSNLSRQNFAPGDVGRFKAVALTERCNLYAGLNWEGHGRVLEAGDLKLASHLVISAVDSGQARRELLELLEGAGRLTYWLDCGNDAACGQVVLGQVGGGAALPHVVTLDPSGMAGGEDDVPSCSAAEALLRQHLFINPAVALQAAQMIGDLLLSGQTESAAVFVNLSGTARVLAAPVPKKRKKRGEVRMAGLLPTQITTPQETL
ncbi:PRTRC system ThiF family protein [Deinococcus marmoris]|uniref:ThiF family protein, ubiquitin-activating enzyme n=1 Tax=Deinococcus marmoris TaxID=249408 RepID=A0A1U7NU01_9DEIO|nr:PRTRC system ThiF family protein [Deinococcus marmoris]OLV16381.1 ThiF family protein, ubiquitin-activating enzyme [Deinococcus marmoris]